MRFLGRKGENWVIRNFELDYKIVLLELRSLWPKNVIHCRIEHDNSGFGPGWHLDKVTISSNDSKYYFHCNNWLADDVGDKQVVRDIAASTDPTGASACKLRVY